MMSGGKFLRSPILAPLVKLTRTTLTVTATGSTLIVLAANAPSAYGLRPDMIVVDELAEWRRREAVGQLVERNRKRPRCRLLAISTAGWDQTSIAWEVRQIAEREADWYFSTRGPCASWVSDTWREQQRRTLPPHVFARLHLNEWVTGVGAFLTSQEVDSIFVEALPAGIDAQGESRPRADTRRITRSACRWLYGSWRSARRGRSSGSRTSRPRSRQGDLVGTHELLEERNLGLATEIGDPEGLEIAEDVMALGLQRLPELRQCHILTLGRDRGVPGSIWISGSLDDAKLLSTAAGFQSGSSSR